LNLCGSHPLNLLQFLRSERNEVNAEHQPVGLKTFEKRAGDLSGVDCRQPLGVVKGGFTVAGAVKHRIHGSPNFFGISLFAGDNLGDSKSRRPVCDSRLIAMSGQ
jgi:hypothetical protein